MARDRNNQGSEDSAGGVEERRRVLIHASSLNRSDIIKKVVARQPPSLLLQQLAGGSNQDASPASASSSSAAASAAPSSRDGSDANVDRDVLDHVDEEGLTALHYAVKKSALDVSKSGRCCQPSFWLYRCVAMPSGLCLALYPNMHDAFSVWKQLVQFSLGDACKDMLDNYQVQAYLTDPT